MAKIIVVDDIYDICRSIQFRLMSAGHDVKIARRGDEAIDYGYLFKPDLLIADWNLESDYNGLEVVEAYRAVNEDINVILISGHMSESLKRQSRNANVTTLAKPFSLDRLATLVDETIGAEFASPFSIN